MREKFIRSNRKEAKKLVRGGVNYAWRIMSDEL